VREFDVTESSRVGCRFRDRGHSAMPNSRTPLARHARRSRGGNLRRATARIPAPSRDEERLQILELVLELVPGFGLSRPELEAELLAPVDRAARRNK
jgi:hypothetical protein